MPPLAVILIAGLAVAFGGLVQSSVGIGIGVVASPVVTLLDPRLMPGTMLVAGTVLPLFVLARDVRHTDWPGVSWALGGRFAGTAAGVWIVAAFPSRDLGALVGAVVLAVVALSLVRGSLPRNRWTLLGAGLVSGATGTSTSIGGPPVALLYQHGHGPQVRASLSFFLFVGNATALAALSADGRLPGRDIATGALLLLFALTGFLIAGRARAFLDRGRLRAAVLAVAAASAAILLARSLLR